MWCSICTHGTVESLLILASLTRHRDLVPHLFPSRFPPPPLCRHLLPLYRLSLLTMSKPNTTSTKAPVTAAKPTPAPVATEAPQGKKPEQEKKKK